MSKFFEVLRYLITFEFLGGIGDTAAMALSFFLITGATSKGTGSVTNLDALISLGMFIIIWYGVMKIFLNMLWHFLFAKKFHWKIGVLEMLHNRLKPVHAQRIVDSDDKDFDEKVEKNIRNIQKLGKNFRKKEKRRCQELSRIKKALSQLNANKYSALGTVTALGAVGVGAYEVLGLSEEAVATAGIVEALTAGGFLGAAGLTIKGILGKGLENPEEYNARKESEAKNKAAYKEGKTNSDAMIKAEADRLAKKLSISDEKALELAKDKAEKAEKEAKEANAIKLGKEATKIAKKQKVSVDSAIKVVAEKHDVAAQDVKVPDSDKEVAKI